MRGIIRASLIGSLLFTLMCAGAILISHGNPEQSDLFDYLGKCDGQPCYLGVVPGETSWDDAVAILEDTPGMEFDPDTNIAANPPGFRGSALLFSSRDDIVNQVVLAMRSSTVNIGELIQEFGFPCGVIRPSDRLALIFRGMSVTLYNDRLSADDHLLPTLSVDEIILANNAPACIQVLPGIPAWRGFARYTN